MPAGLRVANPPNIQIVAFARDHIGPSIVAAPLGDEIKLISYRDILPVGKTAIFSVDVVSQTGVGSPLTTEVDLNDANGSGGDGI